MKHRLIIIFFIGSASLSMAQVGGSSAFTSLKVPTNTKALALGSIIIANPEENVNFFTLNPGLLKGVDGHISIQHSFYIADIHISQINYAHEFKKIGLIGFGLQYFNYGKMDSYDEAGIYNGEFKAADYILTGSYAHQMGSFRFGANIKLAISDIHAYTASAVVFDVGGVYQHPASNLTIGLTIKNAGFVISDYTDESNNSLPFDVQLGTAFKPEHMPFRFSVNIHHLTSLGEIADNGTSASAQPGTEPSTFDKVFRHVALGAELLLSEHIQFLLGYNHLLRQELKLENRSAGAGLSYGIQIRVKKFDLAYSRGHHAAGIAVNQIGLVLGFRDFIRKEI